MKLKKIAINTCYGGFSLSPKAYKRYKELKGDTSCENDYTYIRPEDREDPDLIKVIEELKEDANGNFALLKIVKIPADVEYFIEEYDGAEWVAEKHRTWN